MLGSMRRIFIDKQYVEVDTENAHLKLLSGKCHHALAIHEYILNRKQHLEAVQEVAGFLNAESRSNSLYC